MVLIISIRESLKVDGESKNTKISDTFIHNFFFYYSGEVEISDVDPEGAYVKVCNKGAKENSLSGWQLVRKIDDKLETTFKFHRSVKLEPGATATVWSSDSNQTHEPPSNLVMKSQKWVVADNMSTVLINNNGDEVAQYDRKRSQISSTSSRVRDYSYGSNEEFLHQQGDPQNEDDKCFIM